jgi:uncharacterized OsmC-like protein
LEFIEKNIIIKLRDKLGAAMSTKEMFNIFDNFCLNLNNKFFFLEFEIKNHDYTQEQKKILEKAALECPVALSLDPEINKKVSFNYL